MPVLEVVHKNFLQAGQTLALVLFCVKWAILKGTRDASIEARAISLDR